MLGHADSVLLHVLAVVLRIVLGFALLVYAPESRFPLVLEILGWVAIAAALVLALLPRARFRQLLIRVFDILGGFIRFAAVAAIAFAAFLTYAVI